MFNEVHNSSKNNGIPLAFVKSLNVQVFPSGRRRSELTVSDLESKKYYIPFDPEARLNTEANNRKHSGLNGFTQTYLKSWDATEFSIVLGGYLFTIKSDISDSNSIEAFIKDFVDELLDKLDVIAENPTSIFANIRIDDTALFSGFTKYSTTILRDQASNDEASTCLDLYVTGTNVTGSSPNTNDYYFSGLSFSTESLASRSTSNDPETISLKILEKNSSGTWQIYQPALLPNIEHGATSDSVSVKTLYAENIIQGTGNVVNLSVVEKDAESGTYQLQFSFGAQPENIN